MTSGSSGSKKKKVCLPGDIAGGSGQLLLPIPVDRMIDCNINQLLEAGSHSSRFSGTYRNRPVIVERIKKVHVEPSALAKLLILKHVNVTKLLHTLEDTEFRYYALEISLGSLDQVFLPNGDPKKLDAKMPTEKSFLLKLADGLDFIHSKNLVHGDIRPENVLLFSSSNSKTASVKWTGFGLFKVTDEYGRHNIRKVKGNLKWMAPEMFQLLWKTAAFENNRNTLLLKESDVFPAGCVFFFFLTKGLHPFGRGPEIVSNIRKWDRVNANELPMDHFAFNAVVDIMLQYDPLNRGIWIECLRKCCGSGYIPISNKEKENDLLELCDEANVDELASLCELVADKEVNINCTNRDKRTPLMQICKFQKGKNFIPVFDAILQREDLDVSGQDSRGNSALHLLCRFNRENVTVEVVKRLFQRGLHASLKDRIGYNALHCLLNSNLSDCKDLIGVIRSFIDSAAEIDIHAAASDGHSVLTLLCFYCGGEKLIEAIQLLAVNLKMNVRHKIENGSNVLHLLSQNALLTSAKPFVDAVLMLIQCGADVGAVDENGESALTLLCGYSEIKNLIDAVRFLVVDLKLNLNHQNKEGENALHALCSNESQRGDLASVARFLVDNGIDVQAKAKNGKDSALHVLCSNEHCSIDLLRVLIGNGIDLNSKNIEGDNALHILGRCYPRKKNLLDLVRLLVNAGIDVQSRTLGGYSAIHILWENEDEIENVTDIIQLLIN